MAEITVGAVIGIFGIQGDMKVKPLVYDTELLQKGMKLVLEEKDGKRSDVKIASIKFHKDAWLLRIDGVNTPEEAILKRGAVFKLSQEILPETDESEVYWLHIKGAKVIDKDGNPVGTLSDYVETGSTDVFLIEGVNGKEYMISNNPSHVLNIDPQGKTVVVNPDGLVEQE